MLVPPLETWRISIKGQYRNAFLAYTFALESGFKVTKKNPNGKQYYVSTFNFIYHPNKCIISWV